MKYVEKFKDPRWQKKRLEILARDEWTCQLCNDKESTLHVHHRRYLNGKEPWDYENSLLVTLCDECHQYESAFWSEVQIDLIERLKELFFANDLHELTSGLINGECQDISSVVASAMAWAFQNPEQQKRIIQDYLNDTNSKTIKMVV